MNAGDALVRPFVTVAPGDFARHAAGLMDDFGLSVVPVADQHVFLGVVTREDALGGGDGVPFPLVRQVMSQPVLVAARDTPADALFDAMSRHEVLTVPVLDEGQVVGVVTRLSLLRAITRNDDLTAGSAVHD
ncbi:HPP family protein [Lentzea sp. NPDC058436]|uniref:CBS domain-containing protein n=1 Tax=Lentzea sp. NPDC058436 TaxID=3346499 RepID=UPI00364F1476